MCFSMKQSIMFFTTALITTIALAATKRANKIVLVAGYFALMEGLQVLQYLVIDNCDSKFNQLVTLLGLMHIAFQPLVSNIAIFGLPTPSAGGSLPFPRGGVTPQALYFVVRRLGIAAGVFMIIKTTPAIIHLMGLSDTLSAPLSLILPSKVTHALVESTCLHPEWCCGETLCSMTGEYHLAWSVPLMGANYYIPGMFLHMFILFIPALVCGGTWHKAVAAFTFFTGPVMTEIIMRNAAPDSRRLEFPGVWCLYSGGQVVCLILAEICLNGCVNGKWCLPADGDEARQQGDGSHVQATPKSTKANAAPERGNQNGHRKNI